MLTVLGSCQALLEKFSDAEIDAKALKLIKDILSNHSSSVSAAMHPSCRSTIFTNSIMQIRTHIEGKFSTLEIVSISDSTQTVNGVTSRTYEATYLLTTDEDNVYYFQIQWLENSLGTGFTEVVAGSSDAFPLITNFSSMFITIIAINIVFYGVVFLILVNKEKKKNALKKKLVDSLINSGNSFGKALIPKYQDVGISDKKDKPNYID